MPLPAPAQEFLSDAISEIAPLSMNIDRLIRFYRGHQKDTRALEHIAIQLLSARMTLSRLEWPSTNSEAAFQNPPAARAPMTPDQIEDERHG